jgi:hypothetical protein
MNRVFPLVRGNACPGSAARANREKISQCVTRQGGIVIAMTLALLFSAILPACAQQVAGVTGVVTDSNGGSIAGVQVTLAGAKTGFSQSVSTNSDGSYLFQKIQPGPDYTLTFVKGGFQTLVLSNVYLGVDTTSTRSVQLQIGEVQQKIEVVAGGEGTLNTTDASVGNVLNERTIHELPNLNRGDVSAFLRLEPGVVSAASANADPNGTRDGVVAGARVDQGNITIDGVDANDQNTGQAFTTIGNASEDAIQEVRTVTANPTADQGRSSGGQIVLTTRGGTNQLHGSLREFNRNTAFEANTFFGNKNKTPVPRLNQNQFGANLGGPIKKSKFFYFFDYEANRVASQANATAVVPFDDVRDGSVAYINNKPGCDKTATRTSAPNCISLASPTQVKGFDPLGIGASQALLNLINTGVKYPHVTDPTGGDGINFGSATFNAPNRDISSTYTTREDFNLTKNQQIFGRLNVVRESATQAVANLPGQPDTTDFINHDFSIALGHTWTLGSNNINQFIFGITSNRFSFPAGNVKASFPNEFFLNTPITNPYGDIGGQYRIAPVPTIRDDFSHTHGKHNFGIGFNLRPFHTTLQNIRDFNFVGVGIGGNLSALDPTFRPADILNDSVAASNWDAAFTQNLGRYQSVFTNYNYSKSGTPFPAGTGKIRTFKQRELELYVNDSWRATSHLTVGYGVRWQYEGVPYERSGNETVSNNVDWHKLLATRLQNGLAGITDNPPILAYVLGGPANHGPGYYQQNWKNFSPRLSLAYTPSFKSGALHHVFGDNKSVIRAGGSVVYDRFAVGAFNFIQDQFTYIFQNAGLVNFGVANDPTNSLKNDPRFQSVTFVPQQPAAPTITPPPFTPFIDSAGNPTAVGQQNNYTVDPKFRIPYSYVVNFGVQRELRGNFLLEVDFVGRYAHSLFAAADAGQLADFKDLTTGGAQPGGQLLSAALNAIATQIRNGVQPANVTPQPFIENQFRPGGTQILANFFQSNFQFGDFANIVAQSSKFGVFAPNIGISDQFVANLYGTNNSASSFNGMLVSLRKRLSNDLQFDFNYTLSHSIDNSSFATNASKGDVGIFAPTICDAVHPRNCRGNSEFDARHIFNANGIYDLPFGKGKRIGGNSSSLLNTIIGGWTISTIFQAHSGFALNILSGGFANSTTYTTPALFTGSTSALSGHIHTVNGELQYFANPTAAQAAFSEPFFGQGGNRNVGRGPGYWNFDSAVIKDFRMPWSDGQRLQFRWETFNTFNHPNFAEPSVSLGSPQLFGQITQTVNVGRIMLFGLRYDF